jgi:hypothetical protein
MRIAIEIPDLKEFEQRGGSETGFPEKRRVKTIRIQKAIKTDRGHGKMVLTVYCAVYDRKKPWKAGKYLTMPEIRQRAKANRLLKSLKYPKGGHIETTVNGTGYVQ